LIIGVEVSGAEAALQGAGDIVAETVSDDLRVRQLVRAKAHREGALFSQAAAAADTGVFEQYSDFREAVATNPPAPHPCRQPGRARGRPRGKAGAAGRTLH